MGWAGVALQLVGGITSSMQSVQQGKEAKKEANYNADLIEQKAGLIDVQAGLENSQYERLKRRYSGQSISQTAKSGLEFSGSPMAVWIDTQTQIEMDRMIGQFNFAQEKRFTLEEAAATRRMGKYKQNEYNSQAFSTLLNSAGKAYSYYGGGTKPTGTKPQSDPRGSKGGYEEYKRSQR
jgi:hypothetical protein